MTVVSRRTALHEYELRETVGDALVRLQAEPAPDDGHRHLTVRAYAADGRTVVGQLELSLDVAALLEWTWVERE